MKRRDPGTFKSALTRIVSELGAKHAAQAVGRSQSLVRKWADPDEASLPNVAQAAQLDRAFVSAGLGEPPIQNVIEKEAFCAIDGEANVQESVVVALLDLQAAVGELTHLAADDLDLARRPGPQLSPLDQRSLLESIDVIERETRALKRAVKEAESAD